MIKGYFRPYYIDSEEMGKVSMREQAFVLTENTQCTSSNRRHELIGIVYESGTIAEGAHCTICNQHVRLTGLYKETPIMEAGLSNGLIRCLRRRNLLKLGDISELSEQDLIRTPRFGAKLLAEVKEILQKAGLNFSQQSDTSIKFDSLSKRTKDCLAWAGIYTLAQVCERSEGDLLGIRCFDLESLDEVKELLITEGMGLKGGDD